MNVQLKSTDPGARLQSLLTLSAALLSASSSERRLFLSKNLVGLLIERLGDSETIEVRAEAVGALRNLAVGTDGIETCREVRPRL
jgi:hypothetical protein